MKRLSILLLVLFSQYQAANACSCNGVHSFCQVNFYEANWNSFIGKIIRHDSLFTEFEILNNLRGTETRDTILIWDNPMSGNGTTCFWDIKADSRNLGMLGDTILIVLPRIDSLPPSSTYGVIGDYIKPSELCSSPLLPIKNKLITGHLISIPAGFITQDTMHLDSFKLNYNANGRAMDCDIAVGLNKINLSKTVKLQLYPNPTSNAINISTEESIKSIQIFDLVGKELFINKDKNFPNESKELSIDLSNINNGIYLVHIKLKNDLSTVRRVIKY
ncbi:MAG: T9SS type A sorting domain-containing protein [Flavobacteriales bacterium]|nr:T9SS type A sorting domain-containing protein [Flavobacteriales bacterium]